MRYLLLATSVVIATAMLGTSARAVCNVRGEYCGYPAWAANAFTNPRDRVPDRVLRDADRMQHRHDGRRARN